MRPVVSLFSLLVLAAGLSICPVAASDTPTGEPPPGTWANTIDITVAEARRWQCGAGFYANGGSDRYRFATLTVGNQQVARFDLANPEDCSRVVTVVRNLPENGTVVVAVTVGGNRMGADITGRNRARRYAVQFFVDQIWGEVTAGGR